MADEDPDIVFKALADKTRRALLDSLREHNGQTLGDLCGPLEMARQSATQHLEVLEAANLIATVRRGREKLHYLNPVPLWGIHERWIERFEPPRLRALQAVKRQAENDMMDKLPSQGRVESVSGPPKLFRFTIEVGDLDRATTLYADLFGVEGERHPGARHYFDCGGVTAAVIDVSQGGMAPMPGPKSLYFAVDDIAGFHARASRLGVLAPYRVHGEPAGEILERPSGERSFYVVDPWGNDLCFCEDGTLYS